MAWKCLLKCHVFVFIAKCSNSSGTVKKKLVYQTLATANVIADELVDDSTVVKLNSCIVLRTLLRKDDRFHKGRILLFRMFQRNFES